MRSLKRIIAALAVVIALLIAFQFFLAIYPNLLWFGDVGYKQVYTITLEAQAGFFVLFSSITFLFLMLNIVIVRNIVGGSAERTGALDNLLNSLFRQNAYTYNPLSDLLKRTIKKYTLGVLIIAAILLSLLLGGVQGLVHWQRILAYFYQAPSAVTDPIFGKSLSFYFFTLPFYDVLSSVALLVTIITLAALFFVYMQFGMLELRFRILQDRRIKAHLFSLGVLLFALLAIKFWLARYGILLSAGGRLFHGPGYTAIHAGMLNYTVLSVLAVIAAITLGISMFTSSYKPAFGVIALMIAAGVFLGGIYPNLLQNFVVNPNEYQKEKQYLQYNIAFTRQAYDLNKVRESSFPAVEGLTMNDIQKNRAIIDNIRLWDEGPLLKTFAQLQEIRLYYEFAGVDVDRYRIDDKDQQVNISARELIQSQLSEKAQNWVNQKLQYTHGYGIVMSPVNQFTPDGMPTFYIKDIPPVSAVPYVVKRPEIYFGEKTDNYVIVNTAIKEFDYPQGDNNVYTHYAGNKGINLGSWLNRLVYAARFADQNILFSSYIRNGSKLLYRRNIMERVQTIAPFLTFDSDPYVVVDRGKLYWMLDGFTLSNRYPYSQPFNNAVNYVRNSVKVVVDAYDGSVVFYMMDNEDPLIRTYANIYKGMFKPFSQMPDGLKVHIRLPKDYFTIQAYMYRLYHMTNPQVFYNQEDLWDVAKLRTEEGDNRMEPYYITMRLPEESKFDFLQMVPFTPTNKNNMISWLVAKNGPQDYGKLTVYKLSKDRQIYGPMQIESRIDQDTQISQQLSLWGQKGSRVIRGTLMIIPIEKSLIYVEPLYLQATASNLPQLKRVIVSYGDTVVMDTDLDRAIARVFGGPVPPMEGIAPFQPTGAAPAVPVPGLAREALQYYNQAQERLKSGDWAGYGEALRKLQQTLERMAK